MEPDAGEVSVHRRVLGVVALFWLVAGCSGSATPTVTPTPKPTVTAGPTAAPTSPAASPSPAQGNFDTLTGNGWAKVVAAPDMYTGDGLQLWGCITKLEPATDGFRAQASNREKTDWPADGKLAVFTATKAALADSAKGDVVSLKVVGRGSTPVGQGGGSPMPVFEVIEITRVGTCG
jgi:hypothetical protein